MPRNKPNHGVPIVDENVYGSLGLIQLELQGINVMSAIKHSPFEVRRSESIQMFLRKM